MQCPVCSVDLVMAERQGVEIDYCPKCRGIWLDRGELDKIVERSAGMADAMPAPARGAMQDAPPYGIPQMRRRDDDDDDDDRRRDNEPGAVRRKRGGWLGDIFGGDD